MKNPLNTLANVMVETDSFVKGLVAYLFLLLIAAATIALLVCLIVAVVTYPALLIVVGPFALYGVGRLYEWVTSP